MRFMRSSRLRGSVGCVRALAASRLAWARPAPLGWLRTLLALALPLALLLAGCGAGASTGAAPLRGAAGTNADGPTLVVLGASDAYGVGTYDPDRLNWAHRLALDLPQPIHLVNLGVPGATLAQARQEELPIALSERPQIVVIWLAVNDIIANTPLPTYTSELRDTLATLRASDPGAHVFVGNVPDLTQLPYFADRDPVALGGEVAAWNTAIAQTTAAEGATLADLASGWGQLANHPQYISDDGLHPSALGADELAAFFDILIRRTLHLND